MLAGPGKRNCALHFGGILAPEAPRPVKPGQRVRLAFQACREFGQPCRDAQVASVERLKKLRGLRDDIAPLAGFHIEQIGFELLGSQGGFDGNVPFCLQAIKLRDDKHQPDGKHDQQRRKNQRDNQRPRASDLRRNIGHNGGSSCVG